MSVLALVTKITHIEESNWHTNQKWVIQDKSLCNDPLLG